CPPPRCCFFQPVREPRPTKTSASPARLSSPNTLPLVDPPMLTLPEKALFLILAVISIYYTYRGFRQIIDIIRKGQPEYYSRFSRPAERIREALVRTIAQITVFKSRPVVGFFHSFIFYG